MVCTSREVSRTVFMHFLFFNWQVCLVYAKVLHQTSLFLKGLHINNKQSFDLSSIVVFYLPACIVYTI